MKVDHGLLRLLQQKLQEIRQLASVKVHLFNTPQRQYPLIILQPEQIKSCVTSKHKRIVFSGEISVQAMQQPQLSLYGQVMLVAFEGTTLRLEEPYQATVRFLEHNFTPTDKHGICTLKQSFEAFIHS
jgi:hypothetical protein